MKLFSLLLLLLVATFQAGLAEAKTFQAKLKLLCRLERVDARGSCGNDSGTSDAAFIHSDEDNNTFVSVLKIKSYSNGSIQSLEVPVLTSIGQTGLIAYVAGISANTELEVNYLEGRKLSDAFGSPYYGAVVGVSALFGPQGITLANRSGIGITDFGSVGAGAGIALGQIKIVLRPYASANSISVISNGKTSNVQLKDVLNTSF